MKLFSKNKGIFIAIIIFVVVMFGYRTFFKQDAEIEERSTAARDIGTELIETLSMLQGVNFDEGLIASPGYQLLTDFSAPIPQLPVGRANPFSVLGRE